MAVWGGEKYIPRWKNDREMNRFIDLCFKHMNDIAERLSEYPDQFEPLFGYNDVDGQSYTVVEEWCYGYMRGVALTDWSSLPEALEADGGDCPARDGREQREAGCADRRGVYGQHREHSACGAALV